MVHTVGTVDLRMSDINASTMEAHFTQELFKQGATKCISMFVKNLQMSLKM